MTTQTTAEKIAALLGDDGMTFETEAGLTLRQLCEQDGAHVTRGQTVDDSWIKYAFPDGSAIIERPGAWDLGFTDCECACWQGADGEHDRGDDDRPGCEYAGQGDGRRFEATHVILWTPQGGPTEEIPVHLDEGVAYTQGEWESCARADWEVDEDGRVTFQGQATPGGAPGTVELRASK